MKQVASSPHDQRTLGNDAARLVRDNDRKHGMYLHLQRYLSDMIPAVSGHRTTMERSNHPIVYNNIRSASNSCHRLKKVSRIMVSDGGCGQSQ